MAKEDTNTEDDPSIEEILDSIRQIISEEDDAAQPPEAVPVEEPVEEEAPAAEVVEPEPEPESEPEPEPEPEPEEEVLELTDKIVEVTAPAEPEEEPDAPPEEGMQVDLRDVEEEHEPVESGAVESDGDADSLLTEAAEDATFKAMTRLARKAAVDRTGITIEEIVREEIRPMLRDWLDRSLPQLVERLVKEELERVSARAMEEE